MKTPAVLKKPVNKTGSTVVVPKPVVDQADRVWLSIERKFNTARYENLTIQVGASASLQPGETQGDACKRVYDQLISDFDKYSDEVHSKCKQ